MAGLVALAAACSETPGGADGGGGGQAGGTATSGGRAGGSAGGAAGGSAGGAAGGSAGGAAGGSAGGPAGGSAGGAAGGSAGGGTAGGAASCSCSGGFDRFARPIDPALTFCGLEVCGRDVNRYRCDSTGWSSIGSCDPDGGPPLFGCEPLTDAGPGPIFSGNQCTCATVAACGRDYTAASNTCGRRLCGDEDATLYECQTGGWTTLGVRCAQNLAPPRRPFCSGVTGCGQFVTVPLDGGACLQLPGNVVVPRGAFSATCAPSGWLVGGSCDAGC